jgi:hypothetical protein
VCGLGLRGVWRGFVVGLVWVCGVFDLGLLWVPVGFEWVRRGFGCVCRGFGVGLWWIWRGLRRVPDGVGVSLLWVLGGCGVGLAAIRRGFEVWAWNWFMVVFVKVCGGFGHRFVAVGS